MTVMMVAALSGPHVSPLGGMYLLPILVGFFFRRGALAPPLGVLFPVVQHGSHDRAVSLPIGKASNAMCPLPRT